MTPENINTQQEQIKPVVSSESTKDKLIASNIDEDSAKKTFDKTLSKLAGHYERMDINDQLKLVLDQYKGDKNEALINLNNASLKQIMDSRILGASNDGIRTALAKIMNNNTKIEIPDNNYDVIGDIKKSNDKEEARLLAEQQLAKEKEFLAKQNAKQDYKNTMGDAYVNLRDKYKKVYKN